jgi:hypothetical protein
VLAFIDRYRTLATTESVISILRVLPKYLKGNAMLWYSVLDWGTKVVMNVSLDEWDR